MPHGDCLASKLELLPQCIWKIQKVNFEMTIFFFQILPKLNYYNRNVNSLN